MGEYHLTCARSRLISYMKMKIKKGDKVVVTSGKDKGKQGEVLRVLPREGQSGRIVERPASIHASNVMLVDPASKEPTRIGRRIQDGRLVRFARKSGTKLA